ncbi:hypothetical protein A8M73_31630 [Escherichia coli]|nr:hypothetical protein A8M73_31630 [Escherichia coli]
MGLSYRQGLLSAKGEKLERHGTVAVLPKQRCRAISGTQQARALISLVSALFVASAVELASVMTAGDKRRRHN